MATHSRVLAWRIPQTGEPAVYGVAQSRTQLKRLSSSSVYLNINLFLYTNRYISGEGNGTPLQYSCLENPMNGGAWWAAVHGVTKSRI